MFFPYIPHPPIIDKYALKVKLEPPSLDSPLLSGGRPSHISHSHLLYVLTQFCHPPSRLTARKAKLTNAFVPPGPTTTSILRKPGDVNKQKTFILQKKPQGAPLCHSIAYILLIKLTSRHPPNPPPNPSKTLEDFHDSHSCTWPGDPGDPSLVTLVILSRSSGTSTSLSCK